MDMLIGGKWAPAASGSSEEITSPFDGTVAGTVPVAGPPDVDAALTAAQAGAATWRRTPAHERLRVLLRAAELADERAPEIARLISAENGKAITEAAGEAGRSGDIIRLSAFEGAHLYGDSLPLDASRGTGLDKIGFTVHQPCGVVAAISPFNYPALLVLHKLGPALAAGNAVVLKPARSTPLTALALAACFVDAGLPDGVLSVLTGPGGVLGDALVSDPRVRKVSFTGSTATGEHITRVAGVKKLSLELGASCPVVILPDADIDGAAAAVAAGGYVNAGQVCISASG
jgi:acyl-CoA reductase-like NAD-dependent aldehyde dehydrogenase